MAMKGFLDRRRVDVVPAPNDQFFLATGQPEVTVDVAAAEVAGVEPARAVAEIEPQRPVLIGAQVAVEYVRPGDDEQSILVHRAVTQIPPRVVHDDRFHRLEGDAKPD